MSTLPSFASLQSSVVGITTGRAPRDRALVGLVQQGHSRQAVAAFLDISDDALMRRVVDLDLPTPADKPLRLATSQHAWSLFDIRRLIDLWCGNLTTARIASALSRKPRSITDKARWLGLYRRDRKALLAELPLFPGIDQPAKRRQEIEWTEALESNLADRWLAMQSREGIARDFTALLGTEVSPTTISSKAYRLQLPSRQGCVLLDNYEPANQERFAHFFPGLIRRLCPVRRRWFWTKARSGERISAEAKKQQAYRDLSATVH